MKIPKTDRYRGAIARRLAWTGFGIALAAALAAVAAGFGSRFGIWHFRSGFTILRFSAYVGLASLPVSLASAILSGKLFYWRYFNMSVIGLILGALVFGLPFKWRLSAKKVPPIHDITTDTVRPPPFVAVLPLRKNAPNLPDYGGAAVAEQQLKAYPEIRTLLVDIPPDQAFRRAFDTARSMGWKIVAEVPAEGRIEATDTTFWFGFTDDIVIRITPAGYRSLVDVRSESRVGKSDAGTNAARIRNFLRRFRTGG